MAVVGHVIVLLFIPLFGAGLRTPLDTQREARESTGAYRLLERLFGYSVGAGRRYALLLVVVALLAGEVSLRLWGAGVFGQWWDKLAASFVPVLAAVWAASMLAGLLGGLRWPRSDLGRKLFVFLVLIGLLILSVVPVAVLSTGQDRRPLSAEIAGTMFLTAGTMSAFPVGDMWKSPTMGALAKDLILPFLSAGWYIVVGGVLVGLRLLLRRRRRGTG